MRDTTGIVFDIEEFAVYDGPGIRMAVFLKAVRCAASGATTRRG